LSTEVEHNNNSNGTARHIVHNIFRPWYSILSYLDCFLIA
jgi:hypothetical protein